MSTEAFGSRRVTESLRAIASYLDEGAKVARGVPLGQVIALKPVDVQGTQSPDLTEVIWVDSGTRTLAVPTGDVERKLRVRGKNLQGVGVFKLLSTKEGGPTFEATEIVPLPDTNSVEFTATVKLSDPKNGSYRALAIAEGRTSLNPRKLKIKPLPADPEEPGPGIQLGELAPNKGTPGETLTATLKLLRGTAQDIDEIYLLDSYDHPFYWANIPGQTGAGLRAPRRRSAGPVPVSVIITVPDYAKEGDYRLVVTTPGSGAEDQLLFYVSAAPNPMPSATEYEAASPQLPAAQAKGKSDPPADPPPPPESKSKSQSR
jgi:hypothetical protein